MAGLVLKGKLRRNQMSTSGLVLKGKQRGNQMPTPAFLKKVTELCILFAFEASLIIFYPGGKAIHSDRPRVEISINRRGNRGKLVVYEISREDAKSLVNMKKLLEEYSEKCKMLKSEKLRGKQLERMKMENQSKGQLLVDRPIDELNKEELLTLLAKFRELSEKVKKLLQENLPKDAASTSMSAGGSNASLNGSTDGGSSADPHED